VLRDSSGLNYIKHKDPGKTAEVFRKLAPPTEHSREPFDYNTSDTDIKNP